MVGRTFENARNTVDEFKCILKLEKSLPGVWVCEKYAQRCDAKRVHFEDFALDNPHGEGRFKMVSLGKFTRGRRKGQTAVGKWMKTPVLFFANDSDEDEQPGGNNDLNNNDVNNDEVAPMRLEIMVAKLGLRIVAAFNLAGYVPRGRVLMTVPEMWRVRAARREHWRGVTFLAEPFIESYCKFNNNKDWCDDSTSDGRLMQALSHFSYHVTEGRFLLCDLQGGRQGDDIMLTDPAILSRDHDLGDTDLGTRGIQQFFQMHNCNEFCCADWVRPPDSAGASSSNSTKTVPALTGPLSKLHLPPNTPVSQAGGDAHNI